MARPRKPVALLRLTNTAEKARLKARVEEFWPESDPIGPPPAWLEPEARREWARIADHPQYSKIIRSIHTSAVIEYCCLHARMLAAAQGASDMTSVERQTLQSLRRECGLSPTSAARLKLPQKPAQTDWDRVVPPRVS